MVGDALLDIIFAPEENDGVGMLIGMYAIWLHEESDCKHELDRHRHHVYMACKLFLSYAL